LQVATYASGAYNEGAVGQWTWTTYPDSYIDRADGAHASDLAVALAGRHDRGRAVGTRPLALDTGRNAGLQFDSMVCGQTIIAMFR